MNNLNHPEIIKQIKSHVGNGYDSFAVLPAIYKDNLIATCVASLGNHGIECITESHDAFLVLHHLMRYLTTGSKTHAADMAETVKKNAMEYFSNDLEEIFTEIYNDWEYDAHINAGYKPFKDNINGELRWA